MTDVLLLYAFTRVNVLVTVVAVLSCVSLGTFVVMCAYRAEKGEWPPYVRKVLAVLCTAVTVLILVPTQKDLAIIVGGKIALDAARSPDAREISALVIDRVKEALQP